MIKFTDKMGSDWFFNPDRISNCAVIHTNDKYKARQVKHIQVLGWQFPPTEDNLESFEVLINWGNVTGHKLSTLNSARIPEDLNKMEKLTDGE